MTCWKHISKLYTGGTEAKNKDYSLFGNSRVKISGLICSLATTSLQHPILWPCLNLEPEETHLGAEGCHLRSQGYWEGSKTPGQGPGLLELHWD